MCPVILEIHEQAIKAEDRKPAGVAASHAAKTEQPAIDIQRYFCTHVFAIVVSVGFAAFLRTGSSWMVTRLSKMLR
jgi:predicted cobalt transporter CbtA